MARNQFLFDESTIAAKPAWLRRQLRGIIPPPAQADRAPSRAEPEQTVRASSVGTPPGKTLYSGRVAVRIVSYRRRLLDPDNLMGGCKYFVDALRYCGAFRDDRPQDITLNVSQEKVARKEDERTEIELTPL